MSRTPFRTSVGAVQFLLNDLFSIYFAVTKENRIRQSMQIKRIRLETVSQLVPRHEHVFNADLVRSGVYCVRLASSFKTMSWD